MKMFAWTTPLTSGMQHADLDVTQSPLNQNYQWVPITPFASNTAEDTKDDPGWDDTQHTLIKFTARSTSTASDTALLCALGNANYVNIMSQIGDGSIDTLGGIWDIIFTRNATLPSGAVSANQIKQIFKAFPTTVAISSPLNALPRLHSDSHENEFAREGLDVYSMSIFLKYSIRVTDYNTPDINASAPDRGNAPTNVMLLLVRIPIETEHILNPSTTLRADFQQDYASSTAASGPYGSGVSNTMTGPLYVIQNMFKRDIFLEGKLDNNGLFGANLRPGAPRKDRGMEQGEKMSGAVSHSTLTTRPEHIEHYQRGEPFKVLWRKHYRLGASTATFVTNYQILDKVVKINLGKESYQDIESANANANAAYAFTKYEYRLICVHNGAPIYNAPSTSLSTTVPPAWTDGTGSVFTTEMNSNLVWMKAEVSTYFKDIP
jgi:hypothetical protein